jgi:hypothetical protein
MREQSAAVENYCHVAAGISSGFAVIFLGRRESGSDPLQ